MADDNKVISLWESYVKKADEAFEKSKKMRTLEGQIAWVRVGARYIDRAMKCDKRQYNIK